MKKTIFIIYLFLLFIACYSFAQEKPKEEIKDLIEVYKKDRRGPYHRIKWFCNDGTIRGSKDPCPDKIGGGIQHASFKTSALDLRKTNHLFFGEILAATEIYSFLNDHKNFSRLKQYQLNKYLASIDDGWILRKGQYYRGAIQSEDEKEWGKKFFLEILKNKNFIEDNFYLVRQALKDIPHNEESNVAQKMRSESKVLAEKIPSFMDVRTKIHGNPQKSDILLVQNFITNKSSKITTTEKKELNDLIAIMQAFYAPLNYETIAKDLEKINDPQNSLITLKDFIKNDKSSKEPEFIAEKITENLNLIRENVTSFSKSVDRLRLLDLSNQLEKILLIEVQNWNPKTIEGTIKKTELLTCASYATGLLETWEYGIVKDIYTNTLKNNTATVGELNALIANARRIVNWSTALVKAVYQEDVNIYNNFEPLAYGFIDDRIRNSVTLNLGETVSKLEAHIAKISDVRNSVMEIKNQNSVRGLNPGYAYGKLVVVEGNPEDVTVNTSNIYIFQNPPSDLKPVAGIMTVSEGNLVSHVQLLARNLGIPNATLSQENLQSLKKYNQQNIFYAVSPRGNVIVKSADDMKTSERKLFSKKKKNNNMIHVPTDKLKLSTSKIINMRDVDASDSGVLCGPKAANLGELKKLFPNEVVEGIIIPFGVFRAHLENKMPNQQKTYWQFLNDTFKKTNEMKKNTSDKEVEKYVLSSLKKLHNAILEIDLKPSFLKDLRNNFSSIFGNNIGNVPVFLRSDTNMEDLDEFTGAGLNLTLFNILKEKEIIDGIKKVWASAYTERSFKWRQKYLLNPENVFPSILIIPSVDVDYSGVMITKGINEGTDKDLTIAFSRGAGGAVNGQLAETRLITEKTNILLSPARQPNYIRLPKTGSVKNYYAKFNQPILNNTNINDIRNLAKDIRSKIKTDNNQAFDVEFGFKNNKLWLFQIRPFVENKNAKSSEYLNSISPKIKINRKVDLTKSI